MRAALLSFGLIIAASSASAGLIESACLRSERSGGDRALCGCIQSAANKTLTARDQRLAATFFTNPDRAQEIRMSKRRNHDIFWDRYTAFGETAEVFCAR